MKLILLSLLTGALLYLAFSKYELWLFAFPALYMLLRNTNSHFWLLSGFFFFFLSLRCANIASIDYGGVPPLLSYSIFTLFVLFLALYQFLLPAWINRKLFKGSPYAAVLLYVLFELLRSYVPYGGFPWLILGSLLVYVPLLKHSLLYANVYVQSLLLLSAVAFIITRKRLQLLVLFFLWTFLSLLAVYEKREALKHAQRIKVALVQTAVEQADKLDRERFKKHTEEVLRLVEKAVEGRPHLVLLPESAFAFFYSEEEDEGNYRLKSLSFSVPILVGLIDIREGLKPYNSAYLLKDGYAADYYDKVRLLPVGEYMPYPFGFLKDIFSAISGMDYVPGDRIKPLRYGYVRVATPICFEVAYYDMVRRLSREANLIVVLTNDGWFKDSDCTHQHFLWARVRALENGKYVLWLNNTGDTGVVDMDGNVLASLPYMKRAVLFMEVPLLE